MMPSMMPSPKQRADMSWSSYTDFSPFKQSKWAISPKTTEDLKNNPFSGDISSYQEWHDNMRGHLMGANQGYGRLIWDLEHEQLPLPSNRLAAHPYMPGLPCQLLWVTRQLWTVISRHVAKTYRKSLRGLVNGEEMNGLELWRLMHLRFESGAEEVELADLGALHMIPKCPSGNELAQYLGDWNMLVK